MPYPTLVVQYRPQLQQLAEVVWVRRLNFVQDSASYAELRQLLAGLVRLQRVVCDKGPDKQRDDPDYVFQLLKDD